MAIKKISHIGIAVRDLPGQVAFYRDVLGLTYLGEELVADQQVRVACFAVGESRVELLTPTAESSPVARFLDKRGEGIHHVAYGVDDVGQSLSALRAAGVTLIDEQPRPGAHGAQIAFLHPRSTFGVLTELCSETGGHGDSA